MLYQDEPNDETETQEIPVVSWEPDPQATIEDYLTGAMATFIREVVKDVLVEQGIIQE